MSHASSSSRAGSGPWVAVGVTLVLAVMLPVAAIPFGVVTVLYAHAAGATKARAAALLITVLAVVLTVLIGAGGSVEGGFSS